MRYLTALLLLSGLGLSIAADSAHPVFGKWTWTLTREGKSCTEVYTFLPNHTGLTSSGAERTESRFTVSDKPDQSGFYLLVDEVTKDNGGTGCDGEPGGSPVGAKATSYIVLRPGGEEMLICAEPNLSHCFGPLHRIP